MSAPEGRTRVLEIVGNLSSRQTLQPIGELLRSVSYSRCDPERFQQLLDLVLSENPSPFVLGGTVEKRGDARTEVLTLKGNLPVLRHSQPDRSTSAVPISLGVQIEGLLGRRRPPR